MTQTTTNLHLIESLGGRIEENYAIFELENNASTDGGETITDAKAQEIERQMMDAGYAGALLGSPYNLGKENSIYFEF